MERIACGDVCATNERRSRSRCRYNSGSLRLERCWLVKATVWRQRLPSRSVLVARCWTLALVAPGHYAPATIPTLLADSKCHQTATRPAQQCLTTGTRIWMYVSWWGKSRSPLGNVSPRNALALFRTFPREKEKLQGLEWTSDHRNRFRSRFAQIWGQVRCRDQHLTCPQCTSSPMYVLLFYDVFPSRCLAALH